MIPAYDFCGTLVTPRNTTKEFIKHCCLSEGRYKKYLFHWIKAALLHRAANIDYMQELLKALKGIPAETYKSNSRTFAQKLLKAQNNQLLNEIRDTPATLPVMIISYGLNQIIRDVIELNNIHRPVLIISSTLQIKHELLTGKFDSRLSQEGKLKSLLAHPAWSNEYKLRYFTDDIIADSDICSFAEEVIVVEGSKC